MQSGRQLARNSRCCRCGGALKPTLAPYRLGREVRERLLKYFTEDEFGSIVRINYVDGVRVFFANGDIAHLRPSGNAPQLRLYAVSDQQQRAEQLVQRAIREPDGLFRRMASDLAAK